MTRIILIVVIILLLLAALFYGIYSFININSFKIYVDNSHGKVLTLSRTSNFEVTGEVLDVSGPAMMDNTTLAHMKSRVAEPPIEDSLIEILMADGFNGGKEVSYIASTFYLKNITGVDQEYYEVIKINSATKNIQSAIRVMVVRNYEIEVYAQAHAYVDADSGEVKTQTEEVVPLASIYTERKVIQNEAGEYELQVEDNGVPWMTTDFYSEEYVCYKQQTIAADSYCKYTVIVWLEGWDQDCGNDKLGGVIDMDFSFTGQPLPAASEQQSE